MNSNSRTLYRLAHNIRVEGEAKTWFFGAMLSLCLAMILSLLAFILIRGVPAFWPNRIAIFIDRNGSLSIFPTDWARPDPRSARATHISPVASPNDLVAIDRRHHGALFGKPLLVTQHERTLDPVVQALESVRRLERVSDSGSFRDSADLAEAGAVSLGQAKQQNWSVIWGQAVAHLEELAYGSSVVGDMSVQPQQPARSTFADVGYSENLNGFKEVANSSTNGFSEILEQLDSEFARQEQMWLNWYDLQSKVKTCDRNVAGACGRYRQRNQLKKSGPDVSQLVMHLTNQLRCERALEDLQSLKDRQLELANQAGFQGSLEDATWFAELLRELSNIHAGQVTAWETIQQESQDVELVQLQRDIENLLRNRAQIQQEMLDLRRKQTQKELWLAVADTQYSGRFISEAEASTLGETGPQEVDADVGLSSPATSVYRTGFESDGAVWIEDGDGETLACWLLLSAEASGKEALVSQHEEVGDASGKSQPAARLWQLSVARIPMCDIVRAVPTNRLSVWQRFRVYASRWSSFLSWREGSAYGRVFPALLGTALLTLIMSAAVMPFGVVAAIYLHEYTSPGTMVSAIRVSINNLAAVPSIVYGVFGLGFFCNFLGKVVDGGPRHAETMPLPSGLWLATMGIVAVGGVLAFFSVLFYSRGPAKHDGRQWTARGALFLWVICLLALVVLLIKNPLFSGFYQRELPEATYGKGGILWAGLSLALLTLPVVIVVTEEALASVPQALRVGAYACGASRWQTIRRIVLPQAFTGIVSGALLATVRAVGHVAPLLFLGAVPSLTEFPVDREFPYLHPNSEFMHLGYHIYHFGVTQADTRSAQTVVYASILILVLAVAMLNLVANYLRNRGRQSQIRGMN